jgi:hypothetical protein
MSLRTYEIFAKYIGKASGVKVKLEPNAVPCANPKDKSITLPCNIKEDRVFPALAECIHEACHIRYTTFPMEKVIDDEYEHLILNAIEDIRIDNKAFGMLPNVKGFYSDLFKEIHERRPAMSEVKKQPMEARVLCDLIADQEGFYEYRSEDKEAQEFIEDYDLGDKSFRARRALDAGDLSEARKLVKEIASCFDRDRKKKNKNNKQAQGRPDPNGIKSGLQKLGKDPSKIWGTDPNGSGTAYSQLGAVATREQTQRQFQELLKVKEEKNFLSEEGRLNTENLAAFFTEDIDELFTQKRITRPKKSKIILVLDSSGSMGGQLLDGKTNHSVVCKTAKAITDVLDHVNEAEGLCVEYEVASFDTRYHVLDQDNWEADYHKHYGGGTAVREAFLTAQKRITSDQEIEGNKIIVFLTDGCVSHHEIAAVKKDILKVNSEVRVMIMGVGADPQDSFCREIVGDLNILEEESADTVLMDAIMDALE